MNIRDTVVCATLVFLAIVPLSMHAQASDTFEVSQVVTGAGDVTPPTVPTSLTATAVSTSQIDLTWTASTDDTGVAGYQVFRDGVFVATTTTTSYSDTNLDAGTEYEHTVTAFDAAFNISGLSASVTVSTLSSSGGGGRTRTTILNVAITLDQSAARIFWRTNTPTRSQVSWGRTKDYELGTLAETSARRDHSANIEGLLPSTRYYFKIVALSRSGTEVDTYTSLFITNIAADTTAPASLSSFQADAGEDAIELSWVNPTDRDLAAIRIIRSDRFFPDTPFAGKLIYEGLGTGTVDRDVQTGVTYYYAAFARDVAGNYSAPAVASARLGETVWRPFDEFPEVPDEEIPEGIDVLELLDFDFIQDGQNISYLGTTVLVDGSNALIVSIDYEKVPEVLKTIGITITDPDDDRKTFSFLLRINDDKTHYTATIAPLVRSGTYGFSATVFDLENQKVRTFKGELVVLESVAVGEERTSFTQIMVWLFVGLLTLLILLFIVFRLLRRRDSKETLHV